jgi:putative ABC transport system permease protein
MAGLVMILFLTANVIVQSVRERFAEFATLKALGFSDRLLIGLVVLEAAIPCVLGAAFGMALAAFLGRHTASVMPPGWGLPPPTLSLAVLSWAGFSALVLAFASAALPTLRLTRMDIATALSGRT